MPSPTLRKFLALAVCASALPMPLHAADPVPLIPRSLFFGNPERSDAGISPDGTKISFLAPVDGVMNIWVAPFGKLAEARPVTKVKGHGISNYTWTFRPDTMLYLRDNDGDENDHVYRVNAATGDTKDLTPLPDAQATLNGTSAKRPDEILVGMNVRNTAFRDIYRVNLDTGVSERVLKNTKYLAVLADDDLKPRIGMTVYGPKALSAEPFRQTPALGSVLTTGLPAFDSTGDYVYMPSARGTDLSSVLRVNVKDGKTTRVADGRTSDIVDALISPVTRSVQAVWEYDQRQLWQIVDPSVQADFEFLTKKLAGEFYIHDRTLDDRYWVVFHDFDRSPGAYFLFDRQKQTLSLLFACQPKMPGPSLRPMQPVVIEARDGVKMVSYLTLPAESEAGAEIRPVPMVLWVHGGPSARDTWGYDPVHQWLANRGYAVLSVNYRGSTGFGKNHEDAGMKEWGGKMQADLMDAVDWAVKQGIADPKRIAIGGASYGGYAALCGMSMTPDRFACGVDICGPSNLVTLIKRERAPYFKIDLDAFKEEIGDPDSRQGRQFLLSRSPLTHAAEVTRPILIGQGTNDPRVHKMESDQFVKAMEGRPVPVTYLVYPDEGHGFRRPENDISFYAAMEAFLAKHLGGRAEPMGSDLKGSTMQIAAGGDAIPGLVDARKSTAP